MKTTFKIGAINFNATQPAHTKVTRSLVGNDGKALAKPQPLEDTSYPEKSVTFSVEPMEFTMEAEAGEIAGIYKEILPMFSEFMKAVASIEKAKQFGKD